MILDREAFWPRVISIFQRWEQGGKEWGYSDAVTSVDALVVLCGKFDENASFVRSVTTQYLLFGIPVNDIAIIFTKDKTINIICSASITSSINSLGTSSPCNNYHLKITEKIKGNPESDASTLIDICKASGSGTTIGTIIKEKPNGMYIQRVKKCIEDSNFTQVDISQGLASIALIKDASAIAAIRTSAHITATAMSLYGVGKTLNLAESGRQITHSDWSSRCDDILRVPSKLQLNSIDPADIDVPFYPSIQSGSNCSLDLDTPPDEKPISYDVILLSLSSSFKSLCSTVARTLMINPSPEQRDDFKVFLDLHASVIATMKPGNKIKDTRIAAENFLREHRPEWLPNFIERMGAGIGFDFREKALQLSATNPVEYTPNMTFSMTIGITNIKRKNGEPYSLILGDTILITPTGCDILTNEAPSSASVLLQTIANEDNNTNSTTGITNGRSDKHRARQIEAADKTRVEKEREDDFKRRQKEILRVHAEERMKSLNQETNDEKVTKEIVPDSYNAITELPSQARGTRIFVDVPKKTVVVPINGLPVPFHISHIRNLTKTQSDNTYTIQLRFHTPDRLGKHPLSACGNAEPDNVFLNELTFRSKSPELFQVFQQLDLLRKEYLQQLKEKQMKSSIVEQERLEIINKSPVRLLEIACAPTISKSRKALGRLTAHANGLRFFIDDAARTHIDIINSNIKCCFFQRADSFNNRVLIHFELLHPILIDKSRKTSFVQFYREIAEDSHDVGHNSFEDDEYEAQQEELERQKRKDTNNRFRDFCRMLEEHWRDRNVPVEFYIPSYKLKFTGIVSRSGSVNILPTSGNCLVALDDRPPFVIRLSDIDFILFERYTDTNRNCDITLIHKDLKTFTTILAVGKESVKPLQEWLIEAQVPFDNFPINILWKKILEEIHAGGISNFYDAGGWLNFTTDEDEDEDEDRGEEVEEEDSDYNSEEESADESSSDAFTSDSSSSDDDDDSSSGYDDEDDEEDDVEDWDELERKALKDDEQKTMVEKRKFSSNKAQKRRRD